MNREELKSFLDYKAAQYQNPLFIETDPIQVPHLFSKKEDIEIAGFLTATIAWGNRKTIIKNALSICERMDHAPYDFISNASDKDYSSLESFVHRTFNSEDLINFSKGLKNIYLNHDGLENQFNTSKDIQQSISVFKELFFENSSNSRSIKHISDPSKGSAAKRINMFLRWMVRPSDSGVDFGLWKTIKTSDLSCPLDVHSGTIARKLGLLNRKQNDAKALAELDHSLRRLDPIDPVKYDFALFGIGVNEKFQ